ncbi:MAG: 2-oxo acid dehydrogenase subunit E2 [Propionibacteriaceae bacterium]|nr:2-oxo acid dehydrogenase subunit E2 [Propionibacteriaceae bacterium]
MANVVVMPQLGNPTGHSLVTSWKVQPGDQVTPTTIVAEVETDKSSIQVPSGVEGTVVTLLAQEGDEVPVGAPFFLVGTPDELGGVLDPTNQASLDLSQEIHDSATEDHNSLDVSQSTDETPAEPEPSPQVESPPVQVQQPPHTVSSQPVIVSPRARRIADQLGVDLSGVKGSGPDGRIIVADVEALAQHLPQQVEPPLVEQNQPTPVIVNQREPEVTQSDQELSSDIEEPSQDLGNEEEGVEEEPQNPPARQPEQESAEQVAQEQVAEEIVDEPQELTQEVTQDTQEETPPEPSEEPTEEPSEESIEQQVEETIMASQEEQRSPATGVLPMTQESSLHATPALTMGISAPAQALISLRKRLKTGDESLGMRQVTITDLVAFAVAQTSAKYPSLMSGGGGDLLTTAEHVTLGIVVDLPQGYATVGIESADRLGLKEFSAQARSLIAQAREGTVDQILDTPITLSVANMGVYGMETLTPPLFPTQAAVLGVGAITTQPVRQDDSQITFEPHISFTLTTNPDTVPSGEAAQFLKALVAYISNIDLAILTGATATGG